jgi:hypothetical protein
VKERGTPLVNLIRGNDVAQGRRAVVFWEVFERTLNGIFALRETGQWESPHVQGEGGRGA